VVAVGNAAQTLHPVAGQGLNLGLRDAWELAELLRDTPAEQTGSGSLGAEFARRRRLDRRGGIAFTDALVRIFSSSDPLFSAARGAGLAALDLLPPARRFLAHRMMYGARAFP
jgi:2-octaprenyl-6-methoxyphenol hydroxylase